MPEGVGIEGLLGSEAEEREREAVDAAGADAVALSLAMQKAADDPELSRAAGEYLQEQRRLVQLQIKHFDEERRLAIAAAKRKRFADRIRNCLYTCIALIAVALVVALARMSIEAMNDRSLVVEDFTVPADLAARGVSSQAMAEDLASRVAAIRDTANRNSIAQSNDVHADQAGALKVQIPETGVSIDELERFLHRWLGHQTVLSGQMREEANGQLAVILHVAGAEPIEVQGSGADLDRLMQDSAEKAFASFDPVNSVLYLYVSGRNAEALDAIERYVQSPALATQSLQERAGAYSLLATVDPDPRRALSRALITIDMDPRLMTSWRAAGVVSAELGHDEAAADFFRKVLGTRIVDQPPQMRGGYAFVIAQAHVALDQASADYAALEGDYRAMSQGRAQQQNGLYAAYALIAAALHDELRSRQDLANALAAGSADATVRRARWYVSSSAGDWPQALSDARALADDAVANRARRLGFPLYTTNELALQTVYRPWLAYAEAMNGDAASAAALIAQTPTDCYLCVRMRALIAAASGDAAGADRWFAEAVRQGPDLPMAYWEWGRTMSTRGDLAGAEAKFAVAHEKGPHFADPLKDWGDALVKQGRTREALVKYDEALQFAPNWAALKQARDVAKRQT